jgi:hypothetical protein
MRRQQFTRATTPLVQAVAAGGAQEQYGEALEKTATSQRGQPRRIPCSIIGQTHAHRPLHARATHILTNAIFF